MIPDIVRILTDHDYQIRWYIIGEGPLKKQIQEDIIKTHTQDRVFLLGNFINPYPYIKKCDVYIQPSYEEGYSTTICEAGILGKAIIGTTTSGGIREQICDGISGILAQPTPEAIAEKLEYLIDHPHVKKVLESNVREIDFSHANEIDKIINIC